MVTSLLDFFMDDFAQTFRSMNVLKCGCAKGTHWGRRACKTWWHLMNVSRSKWGRGSGVPKLLNNIHGRQTALAHGLPSRGNFFATTRTKSTTRTCPFSKVAAIGWSRWATTNAISLNANPGNNLAEFFFNWVLRPPSHKWIGESYGWGYSRSWMDIGNWRLELETRVRVKSSS